MTAALAPGSGPISFREAVAAELRAHLARRRMSNRKLAALLGTTPAWIDRRLNGTTTVSVDDLELIAGVLGMSPMQLIEGVANTPAQTGVTRPYHNGSDALIIPFPQVRGDLHGPNGVQVDTHSDAVTQMAQLTACR